ncbi:histidine kinase [Pseudonocardia sp. NPDC046786]|uniref:sensor histidine kinase n=1 Tax=Pseudonocardia sp. NPDC046786 TaxID=3155471 RepID=UPI0033ED2E87
MPWPRALTLLLAGAFGALVAADALLADRSGAPVAVALLTALPALVPVALGLLVAARRPRLVVGPLLALAGAGAAANGAADRYLAAVAAGSPPAGAWWVVPLLLQLSWMLFFVPFALLALVFPDGRLPGRRWWPVAAGLVAVPPLAAVLTAWAPGSYRDPVPDFPHPLGTGPGWTGPVALVLVLCLLPLLGAAAAAPVVRRRRSTDPVLRARLRWLILAGLWLPATLLLCWASYLLFDGPDLVVVSLLGTYLAIPAATAVAILRHGLYDVDRAYAATLTWSALAACLLAVYSLTAFAAGAAFGQGSAPAAAAATAICAAALAPLRVRLRRRIDARIDPARRAALDAVTELTGASRDGSARPEQLQDRLRAALGDPGLLVGYRPPGDDADALVDADGRPLPAVADRTAVPVVRDGRRVGVLAGAAGSRPLLREIAAAAALLVEVVCLRQEARLAQAEAEAGRARLLEVGDTERRRLERDLHDGAQQRLVSLGMTLRLAQRRVADDPAGTDVDGVLDAAVAEIGTAVAELRRIAHGLRPSGLDDGLPAALRGLTANLPVPVRLEVTDGSVRPDPAPVAADPVPVATGPGAAPPEPARLVPAGPDPDWLDVPDGIALTAYYVVGEALTNAVRHADADRVEVVASRSGGTLRVRVRDGGRGGATVRPGHGLHGLADRVAAAGGVLRVRSDGSGTEVHAELPCGS